jgi:hypothetical protein
MIRTPTVAVMLAAALAAVPSSAAAKSPPRGEYECTIGGTYFGSVWITGAKTYKRSGKSGKYTAKGTTTRPGNIRAYKISFTTGAFKGFKGTWHRSSGGVYEIALRNPIDNFESIYCDK